MSEEAKDIESIAIGTAKFSLYDGIMKAEAASPLPPADPTVEVNTEDYKKLFKTSPIICWGADNKFPNALDEEIEKCDVAEAGLKVVSEHLYGQGFFLYTEKFENGKRIVEEVWDDELMDYLYEAAFEEYWMKATDEYPRWGNVVPSYLMNSKRGISRMKVRDTFHMRLERPHPSTNRKENVYFSAQWGKNFKLTSDKLTAEEKKWCFKFPLLSEIDYVDQITGMKKVNEFCHHIKHHVSGKDYGRMPWHACYANRWTGISAAVPEMKMRLFEYAMTLNYLVYFNDKYWTSVYKDQWDKWSKEERQDVVKKKQQEIEANLIGKDNAWKTLFSGFSYNGGTAEYMIKIETIENKMRETTMIPDAQISDGHILMSLGVDPSLMGAVVPGGKQTAGSGSNIREASLALNMRLRKDRERLLLPYYVLRDYFYKDDEVKQKEMKKVKVGVRDYVINTLDQRAAAASSEVTAV